MCIALLSTAHPEYKLILINNRDEFINRPTAVAGWWPSHPSVLGGRDLHRPIQGTWLGITKTGRIAVLTNYREDNQKPSAISRGEIMKKFLTEDSGTRSFVQDVVDTQIARDAGGFSLVCGQIDEELAVISNRATSGAEVPWICGSVVQTVGLSNTKFGDRSWPKVVDGERLLLQTIRESMNSKQREDDFIKSLMEVLSDDALTRSGIDGKGGLQKHMMELRNSILIPPLGQIDGETIEADEISAAKSEVKAQVLDQKQHEKTARLGMSGIYATHKQTVILVDRQDRVRYIERTLFDNDSRPVKEGNGTVDVTFTIEKDNKKYV